MNNQTIERRIYFYRILAGEDEGGEPLPFDTGNILAEVEALDQTTDAPYSEMQDGKVIRCWVDRIRANQRVRLGTIRRTDLPQLEERGILSPLNIPNGAGLAEQIHVVFFPNNIAGSDFNFYGPRLARLGPYFQEKAPVNCPNPITFAHLLKQDSLQELARFSEIRKFSLRIKAAYATKVAEADKDLGASFHAAYSASGASVLELILAPTAYKQDWLNRGLLGATRQLLQQDDLRDNASHLIVKGLDTETNQILEVDLLGDKLISKKRILKADGPTRALNSGSAYTAIEEAYAELRQELELASSVY